VVPARFPNLLVNGAGGIAVGMATNIPPHNLGEVIDGCIAIMDNPAIDLIELMEIIPGPDFPTGASSSAGRHPPAFETGRGSVVMRGKVRRRAVRNDREAIIITEVPYQVNKATDDREDGRTGARQAHRGHLRPARRVRPPGLPRGHRAEARCRCRCDLNQLYRYTPLQTSFGVNMVALNGGKPELMTLIDMLKAFVSFREDVITRRTKYLLRKARERAHVLVGLAIAVANIDEVIH
jgi:DNA gyrase subunit A